MRYIRIGAITVMLIIYIYSIPFTFLPITGKMLLAILGLVVFIYNRLNTPNLRVNKKYVILLRLIAVLFTWSIITMLLNFNFDFVYHTDIIGLISSFFSAYLIAYLSRREIREFNDIVLLITIAIFLENLLTLGMKISPSLNSIINSIQVSSTVSGIDASNMIEYNRLVGLGEAVYFGVLPSCALGLTLTGYLYLTNYRSNKILYIVMMVTTSIISCLITRYSILLVLLTIFMILYKYYFQGKYLKIVTLMFIATLLVAGAFILLKSILPENMYNWAFEFLIANEKGGTIGTSTTDTLFEWFLNFKISLKSLLVGDGQFTNPDGTYYMHTDVGFFRILYYVGLPGLLMVLYIHYMILSFSYKQTSRSIDNKLLFFFLFISYCIILLKGYAIMTDLFLLMLVMQDYSLISLNSHEKNMYGASM